MKKYWLVTDNGNCFEERLDAEAMAEAVDEAIRSLGRLSAYDRRHLYTAYVVYANGPYTDAEQVVYIPTDGTEWEALANWYAAEEVMDDDLREAVHADLAPCDRVTFLEAYMDAHARKFGETFTI